MKTLGGVIIMCLAFFAVFVGYTLHLNNQVMVQLEREVHTEYAYPVEVHTKPEIVDISTETQFVSVFGGVVRTVTAYTSHVAQTDDTPCIAAWGDDICAQYNKRADGYGICASNAFAYGTRLYVEGFGPCVVLDRMNRRYPDRVDVYMGYDYDAAIQWGRRNVIVTEI